MTEQQFAGKNALITGGSTGIGYSIAMKLAQQGAKVCVTGRTAETGAQAAAKLAAVSPGSFFLQGNAGDAQTSASVVAQAVKQLGGLDILVSAGAQGSLGPTPFEQMTLEQVKSSFETRLFGRIFPVHSAIPFLRERGGGAILMIGTDAARHPTPGESIIGAAGASVILLTKALARELARHSIRVNALALTITSDTPSWDRIFSKASFENKLFSKAVSRFPSGRAPTSDEVADAGVFLVSPQASQIDGQTVSVNGGLSFGGW